MQANTPEKNKYNATWVSYSSITDFLKCPKAYYLKNVYKNPKSGRKISIVSPALSIGSAVHEVVEGLAKYKAEERKDRLSKSALKDLNKAWEKYSGLRGGFVSKEDEQESKERSEKMLKRVIDNPEPLLHKTVKIKDGDGGMPPYYYLSSDDNIILCGKIDWLIYKPEDDSVHILDFKTGRNEEKEESLQLPIYELLLKNLQKRKVSGASYWYLDKDDKPTEMKLSDYDESLNKVLSVAKQVKSARDKFKIEGEEVFTCRSSSGECFACKSLQKIIRGEAQFVGVGEYDQELYIV